MTVTWDDFAARLLDALRVVGDRTYLIVSPGGGSRRYVQFAGSADMVVAETPPVRVVPDTDEAVLTGAGWTAPMDALANWTSELALPALTSEYADLTHRCVVALRDALALSTPEGLGYRAWRDPEPIPQNVTLAEEDLAELDPGENPLAVTELGLPYRDDA